MLWIIIVALTAAVLAALIAPFIRAQRDSPGRAAYNLAVYGDQLREIDIDVERGVLSAGEADSARIEISRRMLDAAPPGDRTDDSANARGGRARGAIQFTGLALIVLAVPAIAGVIYVSGGSPNEADQPFASRADVRAAQAEQQAPDGMAEMVRRLSDRLAREPGDLEGWLLLGRSYTVLRRYTEAAQAYARAAGLAPDDATVLSFLGESLVYSADGTVTQPAIDAFDKVLAVQPKNVAARFYLALARAQAGRLQDAYDGWFALAADSPADAPWLPDLSSRLRDAAGELGIAFAMPEPLPPAQVAAAPSAPAAPAAPERGPTAEDIEAAGELGDDDRGAFIRSMVERLAARLEENPNDPQGWQQLARSYEVLGETEKAAAARARAEALGAGQTAAAPAAPARGPTQDQIDGAAGLSAEQQSAMALAMVERLAARLEDEPDDADGWLQLARSYEALERPAESEAAYARAAGLRPNDVNVLALYARSMLGRARTDQPLAPHLVDVYRRIVKLDGQNPEALYFAGLGEAQAGNTEIAVGHWERLLSMLDPGSEAHGVIKDRLDDLRAGQ